MLADTMNLASTPDAIRLFLHILAASIWVGGQFVMLGVIDTAKGIHHIAMVKLCKALGWLSWPALVVLIVTGIWNVDTFRGTTWTMGWKIVLVVKIVMVVIAGLTAFLHGKITAKIETEWLAGIGAVASVLAVLGSLAACSLPGADHRPAEGLSWR